LGADASRPAAGAKIRHIQIFMRFYALSAGRFNVQDHELIFSRALSAMVLHHHRSVILPSRHL
jgi:hypothetical protein